MPGPVSEPYPGPPVCACGHFKELHYRDFGERHPPREPGPCQGEGCPCQSFQEVPLEETEFGAILDDFLAFHAEGAPAIPPPPGAEPSAGWEP
jgi:hypothetical protein